MEAKDTMMTYGECQAARLPDDALFTDDEREAQAQAEISFRAGVMEVVEWIERDLIYIALEYNGTPVLHLQTNEEKSAERWQAKLKEWGVRNEQTGRDKGRDR